MKNRTDLFTRAILIATTVFVVACAKKAEEPQPVEFTPPAFTELSTFTEKVNVSLKYLDAAGTTEKAVCDVTWGANNRLTGTCPKLPPGDYRYVLEYRDKVDNTVLASATGPVGISQNSPVTIAPTLVKNDTNIQAFLAVASLPVCIFDTSNYDECVAQ